MKKSVRNIIFLAAMSVAGSSLAFAGAVAPTAALGSGGGMTGAFTPMPSVSAPTVPAGGNTPGSTIETDQAAPGSTIETDQAAPGNGGNGDDQGDNNQGD